MIGLPHVAPGVADPRGRRRADPSGQARQLLLMIRDEILSSMSLHPPGAAADTAVLNGGPLDGREHSVEEDAADLCVVMTDGQQHRYRRTNTTQPLSDGRIVLVFDWVGRYYGPQ